MDKIVLIDEETVKVYIMSEQDKSRMVIIDKIVDPPKTMQFNLLDGLENDTRLAGLAELGVNVKMFGAKGDGTTDDTAAFKMAIAAVTALSYSGTVEIPYTGHEYIISDTIELPSNTVLRGVGTAPTLKLANSINKDFIYSTQKSNVRLENLVIDGNMANQRTDLYPGYYFRPIHMDRINGLTL
jgi:hypothetical protein